MTDQAPWYSHLPEPKSQVELISVQELNDMIKSKSLLAGKDFVVVDVRRNDLEDDMIPHAINLPSQTFHASLPVVHQLLNPIPLVVFHCNKSNGRGPRTAGWYADYLVSKGESLDKVKVLKGGIVAWREQFPGTCVKVP